MQNTINLGESLDTIKSFAANPFSDMRTVDSIEVGQFVRQGDIYVRRIADGELRKGWTATSSRQLAPGTTQGSRHTVDESVEVLLNQNPVERRWTRLGLAFEGPVLKSNDRFTVSHPEHADISLPGGCYEVLYQSDFASQRRAKD